MADFITVSGLQDLQAKLKSLSGPDMEQALRGATFAGCKVFLDEAVRLAPEYPKEIRRRNGTATAPGTLKRSLIVKRLTESTRAGVEQYIVTVRKGKTDGVDGFYAAWVEFGHFYVPPKPKGIAWKKHRDNSKAVYVPAHPFMRPAFEAMKSQAKEAIKARLLEKVEALARD